ncbi:hypothetical protein EauM23_00001 [Exiguobacterium phage vB_EauM-23]|nr:hypothetical protein EauM23_00001 [Exiguobacterium phage vB_EauM-23]
MDEYTKRLEAENAGLHILLDKAYDDAGERSGAWNRNDVSFGTLLSSQNSRRSGRK